MSDPLATDLAGMFDVEVDLAGRISGPPATPKAKIDWWKAKQS